MDRDLLTSHKMLLSACEALAQAMGNVVDSLPAAGSARQAVGWVQHLLDQARALTPELTNAPQQDHEPAYPLDPTSFREEPNYGRLSGPPQDPADLRFIPAGVRSTVL